MEKVVRDAVHGDILLGREEVELLDTPEMQRLRGVKQLGTASWVYPSATHTRFEHSLGSAHLARRILDDLAARDLVDEDEARLGVICALLHDVDHLPYGHTLEDERGIFPRHDHPKRFAAGLGRGHLGERLQKRGRFESVLSVLVGNGHSPILSDLVTGTIGADLLDYLARDAYFCGFRQRYDERIFRYFDVSQGRLVLRVARDGLLRPDAVTEIVSLLRLRYVLSERVYYHHAKVAAGLLIARAVEEARKEGLEPADLRSLSDEGLIQFLRMRHGGHEEVVRYLDHLAHRRLPKRAYLLTPDIGPRAQEELLAYRREPALREEAEEEIGRAAGVERQSVIVHCPALDMARKRPDVPVVLEPGGKPFPLAELDLPEVKALVDMHRSLWRFTVHLARDRIDRLDAVREAAAEWFEFPDQRRSPRS